MVTGWKGAVCLLTGLALLISAEASAQDHRPLPLEDQADWSAVGMLYFGARLSGAICTGTLVAPDLVLTAGHCVGKGDDAAALTFAAGWRQGQAVAMRRARAVVLAQKNGGGLADDLALVVLDAAIPLQLIAPLPLLAADDLATSYVFMGYRRDAPEVVWRRDDCGLVGVQTRVLDLNCPAISGNSGGPLLVWQDGHWQIAAVMVARARDGGQARSYAAIPGDDLRARMMSE